MRHELRILFTGHNMPDVKIRLNRAEIDIPADIKKSERSIQCAFEAVETLSKSISMLRSKKIHYRNLIKAENRFSNKALQTAITGTDVEIRQMQDVINNQLEVQKHHLFVIEKLESRLKEPSLMEDFNVNRV